MVGSVLDDDRCYEALRSRDARFDGWFYAAVLTTRIYCRPSCPARLPKRPNVCFYPSSAAAHRAGFRACKRCRPDASPGSPEWNVRADVTARAMRLIRDGVVDRDGVPGLARRLGYSERQLHRLLTAEVGAGPLALARAQRAQTARILIETTDLPLTEIAFAAGFSSVRQFNDTILEVFAAPPSALRSSRRRFESPEGDSQTTGIVSLRLPYRQPFAAGALFAFLGRRAVPGIEAGDRSYYSRTLRLPHGPGIVDVTDDDGSVRCTLSLGDWRDLNAAGQRLRRLLDLDADPVAIDRHLSRDPFMAPLVAQRPGLRSPGHVDPFELAVRAIIGQQVSVAGARTVASRLVQSYGKPLSAPAGPLTHSFPAAATLAEADPDSLAMPRARGRAIVTLAAAVADGRIDLDVGADPDQVSAQLLALPGIGPWTVAYIRLRALGDPDAFLPTDLGVRHAQARLGLGDAAIGAQAWRPWRAYALHHLWASLDSGHDAPPSPSSSSVSGSRKAMIAS